MFRKLWLGASLAAVLGGALTAQAQYTGTIPAKPPWSVNSEGVYVVTPELKASGSRVVLVDDKVPAETKPAEQAVVTESPPAEEEKKWGPTAPENVKLLSGALANWLPENTRIYGWLDFGYTYASTGPGPLTVETRENRFGNEFLFNEAAIVFEKTLKKDEWSWGYNATFYAGADAALLQPKGGMDDPPGNPRFSYDFRQLYVSAHAPILTEGGVDIKVGRMGTIIGYNSALAPYRPFYSSDYQWFYAQDGAFTGILTNWHISKQLDVLAGVTLGANTFFTERGETPCWIGQVNYWLQEDKRTLLSASVYAGNNAIFAAPGLAGKWDTTLELRVEQNWSKQFTQILQSDMGWDEKTPVGTGQWYGVYTILIYHLTCQLDTNFRAEWFDDVNGTRTGFKTVYWETTAGLDYHPYPFISLRPEVRGDFAEDPVFRNGHDKSQLTVAIDCLLKF
jgi:hypothetical protein